MKIICSGCGAKHWLSDMQLSDGGCNVVCPHCSTTNFVDASMVDPMSLEPRWYYAINEETVGPLSTRDLEFSFQNGQLTLDSYVWCDGMSEWMVLGSVAEFDYLLSPVQGEPYGVDEATRVAGGATVGAFAQYPSPGTLGNGEETAAIDLSEFNAQAARSSYSPFDNNAAGGIVGMDGREAQDDEPVFDMGSQQPSANAANDMVGARSENSVLFSLSSLQAVSAGPAAPAATPATAGGGAGLIDVKALASSAPAPRRRTNEVIDSFGGSAIPMATVLPLGNKKDNTPIYIGIAIAAAVLIALVVIIVLVAGGGDNDNAQQQVAGINTNKALAVDDGLGLEAGRAAEEAKKAAEEEAAKKAAEEEAAKKAAEEEAAKKAAEEEAAKKAAEEEADDKEADDKEAEAAEDKKADTKADARKADTKKADTKKADTKKADTKTETKKTEPKKTETKKTETKKADAAPAGGASLTKADIQSTLRGAGAQLRTCSRTSAKKGTMKVSFVIKGNGSVGNARCVSPEFANTPTAACVLKVINGLKFKATGGADVPVNNYGVPIQ